MQGAEVMLTDYFQTRKIYVACGYTDLRCGIDGLVGIVKNKFELNPYEDALFMFCGRRSDRIKCVYWDGDGFILLYKRLEAGTFQWPRTTVEARAITAQQYRWLMEGLCVDQPRAHRPYETAGVDMV